MAAQPFNSLLEANSAITAYTSSAPEYVTLKANFVNNPAEPCIILRPQTVQDVEAIVTHCVENNLPFAVRSGGHDLSGRSTVGGAATIDMRDIAHVEVATDSKTARIGGGIMHAGVLQALEPHGLITPVGSIGTVGYAGWSTLGGYGSFSPSLGLGIDQIVGAKVVGADGKCREADERLLRAMRGGGGNFGVIVELTVKVYPATEVSIEYRCCLCRYSRKFISLPWRQI
jgi:FAD/FMN-containing dehydrogenase